MILELENIVFAALHWLYDDMSEINKFNKINTFVQWTNDKKKDDLKVVCTGTIVNVLGLYQT